MNTQSIYCEHNHSGYRIHTRRQGTRYHASYDSSHDVGDHASYRTSCLSGYCCFQVNEEEVVYGRGAAVCSRAKTTASATAKSVSESHLWHRQFGHLNPAAIQSLINEFTHGDDVRCVHSIKAQVEVDTHKCQTDNRTIRAHEFRCRNDGLYHQAVHVQ